MMYGNNYGKGVKPNSRWNKGLNVHASKLNRGSDMNFTGGARKVKGGRKGNKGYGGGKTDMYK